MHRDPRLLVAVLVASIAVFALLAWGYTAGGIVDEADRDTAEWVAEEMPYWAEWLARPFSWFGGWVGLTVIAALAAGELFRRRRLLQAVTVVAALVGAQLLTSGLKVLFERPRPEAGSAVPLPTTYSFPSGHATTAAAFVGLLTLLAAHAVTSGRRRAVVLSAGVAVALAIGASRVVLNVHYLSDVLAGFAVGSAVLAACLLVLARPRSGEQTARSRHDAVTHS